MSGAWIPSVFAARAAVYKARNEAFSEKAKLAAGWRRVANLVSWLAGVPVIALAPSVSWFWIVVALLAVGVVRVVGNLWVNTWEAAEVAKVMTDHPMPSEQTSTPPEEKR